MSNEYILPDVLRSGLKLIVCGSAVGDKSAKANSYYAGYNNMFWKILCETKLTDCLLKSKDYHNLLNSDIGLTDLAKKTAGVDAKILYKAYDADLLIQKINIYKPKVLCFNGKAPATVFYGYLNKKKLTTVKVNYGEQPCIPLCGETIFFIAPSTSGAARRYWKPSYWFELAKLVNDTQI